jgi:hypothetical protein
MNTGLQEFAPKLAMGEIASLSGAAHEAWRRRKSDARGRELFS